MTYEDIVKSLQEQISDYAIKLAVTESQLSALEQKLSTTEQELDNLKKVTGIDETKEDKEN